MHRNIRSRLAYAVFWAASATSLSSVAVPPAFQRVAAQTGVPAEVLYSIAQTESGMSLNGYGFGPWPWTLNVAGKPERFDTEREAVARLEALLNEGVTNIDIGLMQVNWWYHRHRFAGPKEALDAYRNLEVGARILRELWDAEQDLWRAIGSYHAGEMASDAGRQRAESYRQRVARAVVRSLGRHADD